LNIHIHLDKQHSNQSHLKLNKSHQYNLINQMLFLKIIFFLLVQWYNSFIMLQNKFLMDI